MQLTVRHTLSFTLGTPARAVAHLLLTPLNTPQQKVERWSIDMPGLTGAAVFRDGFGNKAHLVSLHKPAETIEVVVEGRLETADRAGVLGRLEYDPMPAVFRRRSEGATPDPAILSGLVAGPDRIALLHELMGRIHEHQGQSQSQSQDGQSQSQGLDARPQDAAAAFLGAARALDIPARYVTGYLLAEDGAASVHAWAEAFDDRLGWIGFDPLLNVCPTDHHIRLASGLDAASTMPIRTVPVWPAMPAETVEITAG